MADHVGSCLCGAVTFEVYGEFDSFYLCHCHHCQKDTGTAHGANLFSRTAALIWLTGEDGVMSFTLPSTGHTKSFCQRCGSALPNTQMAGLLVVPAGCLDSVITAPPTAHLFCASKAAWEDRLAEAPQYDGLPK